MTLDNVLIADDEPELVAKLQAVFIANGFKTLSAANGVEAWEVLIQHPEDIAACVLDLQMPPGSFGGRDLVAKIRRSFSTLLPIVIYSGRGTVSLSHEVTKAGANEFVEKESGPEHLVNVVARLTSEVSRPGQNSQSSLNALAASGDVQWLASRSFKQLETHIRTAVLSKYTPRQLHDLFSSERKPPPRHVMDRLLEIEEFTNEIKLSLGDLLDLIAALSAAQTQPLPPAKKLNSMKQQIVPARNDLLHGREVSTRTLLIALMAADELTDTLIGNVNE
jgi:DNA-binding response OmpR family regulator